MHDYYKRRMEEAPTTACIVGVCIVLAGVLILVAWFIQK